MTIRPLPVAAATVDSEVGELQDLLDSASLASGNGPSHRDGFLARMFGLRQMRAITYPRIHRRMGVAYACLACRPPVVAVSEKISAIWEAERREPGAKIVEFSGTHL
jgi:hypothetical protein